MGRYPNVRSREGADTIIHAIGMKRIDFAGIRSKTADFAADYGIPELAPEESPEGIPASIPDTTRQQPASNDRTDHKQTPDIGQRGESDRPAATSLTDPKLVKTKLRAFTPRGDGREKVVVLRDEAQHLSVERTPFAFCFLLRSMFEISAKAYCAEHTPFGGPSATSAKGDDRKLVDVLRDITAHINKSNDRPVAKKLHGAMAELGRSEGLLSVTSMNQLVHNSTFMVSPTDICILFHNVFPLLAAMNE